MSKVIASVAHNISIYTRIRVEPYPAPLILSEVKRQSFVIREKFLEPALQGVEYEDFRVGE
jgi:hypothetical protein